MHSPSVLTGAGPVWSAGLGVVMLGLCACAWCCLKIQKCEALGLLGCLGACCGACLWVWKVPGASWKHAGKAPGCLNVRCVTLVTMGLLCCSQQAAA